ncbi:hypothetical protein ANOBCDAF_04620 [Pleomorphomonas sp. T1.2MG-36]|uniref:hypothetical protein n=1 Tax=Pleomorphomonas sp. T1.2MG-36 TaxID=3041167 RepID=UPI0024772EFB|nr:hypothetical protein [Pleomorphomonas sp. T1.2MG-36]CAI9404442.1 hypothetical protein ANOBCDAF_04620 [Pleomorphomonas sp. T1.2MG-36]
MMYRVTTYVVMAVASVAIVCASFPYLYIPWIVLSVLGAAFIRDGEHSALLFLGIIHVVIYSVLYLVLLAFLPYSEYMLSVSSLLCDVSLLKPSACEAPTSLTLYAFTWSALFLCALPMAPISISTMIVGACEGKNAKARFIAIALIGFSICCLYEVSIMRYGADGSDQYKSLYAASRILARDYGVIPFISVVIGTGYWAMAKLRVFLPRA